MKKSGSDEADASTKRAEKLARRLTNNNQRATSLSRAASKAHMIEGAAVGTEPWKVRGSGAVSLRVSAAGLAQGVTATEAGPGGVKAGSERARSLRAGKGGIRVGAGALNKRLGGLGIAGSGTTAAVTRPGGRYAGLREPSSQRGILREGTTGWQDAGHGAADTNGKEPGEPEDKGEGLGTAFGVAGGDAGEAGKLGDGEAGRPAKAARLEAASSACTDGEHITPEGCRSSPETAFWAGAGCPSKGGGADSKADAAPEL